MAPISVIVFGVAVWMIAVTGAKECGQGLKLPILFLTSICVSDYFEKGNCLNNLMSYKQFVYRTCYRQWFSHLKVNLKTNFVSIFNMNYTLEQ